MRYNSHELFMKNYKRILALILLSVIVLTSFTGCGKGKEEINIYTKLQNLSDTEKFDFEVNAKFYVKKTENVEIKNPTSEESTTETTESSETVASTTETTAPTKPSETSEKNSETNSTESVTENKTENETDENVEEDIIVDDSTKSEVITTETDYNLRLVGTYLGQEQWSVKVFAKDANTKGYTNITNIYRKDKDVYFDVYSMIDSLDYLLEANGAILNQFDFSKGNVIKTDIKTLLELAKSENSNRNTQLPDIITVVSTDLCNIIEKVGYDVSVIDGAFDAAIEIANNVAKSIEEEANIDTTENKKDKNKEKEVFSFISQDETGTYSFHLDATKPTTQKFIKKFGNTLNKELLTTMESQINSVNTENKKEGETTTTTTIKPIQDFISQNKNWIKDYGTEIAASADEFKVDFTNTFNASEKDGKKLTTLTFSYDKENENLKQTSSINIKINETTEETIELPTKILDNTTINALHDTADMVITSYLSGTLENEDTDLTPDKMVSIGKLVKPSQNENFKYKIFDRYISISEYIGKEASVKIPDTIEELPVFVIEESAFANNKDITSVSMTDNIIQIHKNAFSDCTNLTSLTLSKNLNDIPDSMCRNCENLNNVEIHNGIKSIGANAFNECKALTEIAIPSTVSNIGMSAFAKCQKVETIVIMDGTIYDEEGTYVKTIGLNIENSAFMSHRATTVILPQTVLNISSDAFVPDYEDPVKTMYYGYSPSELNELCASQKYLFTSISLGGELDKAIKSDTKTALKIAKSF